MIEVVALAALAFSAFLIFDVRRQRAEWSAERSRLLDRIMSTDYREYRALSTSGNTGSVVIVGDADEARLEAGG